MRSGQCMELVTGGSDMWIFIVFICVTVTAIIIFVNYRRTKKTMDTIEEMLNVAVKGEFTEGQFDETRMSALETKFAHYLSASALSAQNVEAEKDKIKALIADISHQTKTPIANLLLYSELLLEEELPQQIEGNVSAIHEQTQKLKFLIESLVKLSRLENGILQLVPRMEKLQPMLERAVWELKQKAEEKGLQISLHNTDVEAYFDPKWTGEAICNVIDNAIKYTEHGEISISAISYEMFVRIDIADTGCGIREEELPKIFRRFYRSELVKDEEGVGIGLYLTREILQEQGGYIKVTSVYGQGTAHEAEKEPHAVSRILLGFNNQLSVRREMRGRDKGDTVPAGCPGPSVIANHQGTIRSAEHTAMSGARNMTAPFQNRVFFRFGIRA